MGIRLDRLMEALGLDTEWTEEDRAEIKERRSQGQPTDHIIDDIQSRRILKRIKELVVKLDKLQAGYVYMPYIPKVVDDKLRIEDMYDD